MERSFVELIDRLRRVESSSPRVRLRELGSFRVAEREYTLYRVDLRGGEPGAVRVCISAGMHGDEPAGVEAALRFLETNADNESLLRTFSFVIFPCDNPSGYELGTRENALGIDLNREFNTRAPADEVAILQRAVEGESFDHVYELHEDVDSYGLYLYELAVDSSLRVGPRIIRAASAAGYPINLDECIEGREARCGVIAPGISRFRKTRLPKALYMARLGARHVMTVETPGRALPLEDRVRIHLMGLGIGMSYEV